MELLELMYHLTKYFRLIGSDYFRVTKENDIYKFNEYSRSFTKLLLNITSITILYTTNVYIVNITKEDPRVSQLLISFMSSMVAFYYIDAICNVFTQKSSQWLWKAYLKLEQDFKTLGERIDFRKTDQLQQTFMTTYAFHAVCLVCYGISIWEFGWIQTIQTILIVCQFAQAMCFLYFAATFHVSGIFFEQLDKYLKKKVEGKNKANLTSYIVRAAQIHQELCELWLQANNIVSFRIFYLLVFFYFSTAFHAYNMVCNVLGGNCNSLFATVIGFTWNLSMISLIVTVSRNSRKKALAIQKYLFKIANTSTQANEIQEANAFLLQIGHENLKVSAIRIFYVDWELVFKAIGEMTTTLTILVQSKFDASFE